MNGEWWQNRLLMRGGAMALGVVLFIVSGPIKSCWNGMTSTCTKIVTEKDLAAVRAGDWERDYLYDCEYFCDATYRMGGVSVLIDLNVGDKPNESDNWMKELSEVREIGGLRATVAGFDAEYKWRTIVMRRPHGGIRIRSGDDGLTYEELEKLAAVVAHRVELVDDYFAPKD